MLFAIFGDDALLGELLDGSLVNVNNINRITIELLIVVLLQAGPLHSPWVWWLHRREKISFPRISNPGANVLAPKVVYLGKDQHKHAPARILGKITALLALGS